MENISLIFKGTKKSETHSQELECCCINSKEGILIEVRESGSIEFDRSQSIILSKETAVKLVRHLKKEIGFLNVNKTEKP